MLFNMVDGSSISEWRDEGNKTKFRLTTWKSLESKLGAKRLYNLYRGALTVQTLEIFENPK